MSEAQSRPADPLSVLSLGAGIGALVTALFSLVPLMGVCTLPISVGCALTGLVSGVASLMRTTLNRQLEGRLQALAGLGLSLLWCLVAGLLLMFAARPH